VRSPAKTKTENPQNVLLERLRPWLSEERCRTCDCFQGALVQLELDGGESAKRLVEAHRVPSEQMHACLGCDPCLPAEAWVKYIREPGGAST
jgi:hypothetical protein